MQLIKFFFIQEIAQQKDLKAAQDKLEEIKVMEYLKQKAVSEQARSHDILVDIFTFLAFFFNSHFYFLCRKERRPTSVN